MPALVKPLATVKVDDDDVSLTTSRMPPTLTSSPPLISLVPALALSVPATVTLTSLAMSSLVSAMVLPLAMVNWRGEPISL